MSRVHIKTIAPEIIKGRDDLRITAPLPDATILIDGDFISTHILRKFSYWSFDSDLLTASTEFSEFLNYFQTYARVRQEDFYRLWQALTAEYNPIENYNQIEIIKHGEIIASGTVSAETDGTNSGSDSNVQTGNIEYKTPKITTDVKTPEIKTKTKNGKTVSTQERSTYDSTDFNNVEKLTNEQQTDDEVTVPEHTVTTTVTHDADDKTTFNDVTNTRTIGNKIHNETSTTTEYDTVTKLIADTNQSFNTYSENKLDRHGNIGVTSNQNMISQEWELRLKNVAETFIDIIIESFCYLVLTYDSGGDREIEYYFV